MEGERRVFRSGGLEARPIVGQGGDGQGGDPSRSGNVRFTVATLL